jgi:hypothetical protein
MGLDEIVPAGVVTGDNPIKLFEYFKLPEISTLQS